MWRIIFLYGAALGSGVLLLQWLDYKHWVHDYSTELYVAAVAVFFALVGGWTGNRLTARPRGAEFVRNAAVLQSLGISDRECEVLALIVTGDANKVIARKLSISPNTVKTHLANLFAKLDVNNRTEAIYRARSLEILP